MKKISRRSFSIILGLICLGELGVAEDIDTLLNEYSRNNALSQETIDQNKGHLILFTREKLERMHAKTLKDVMKVTPFIYYHENRYALPDPLDSGAFEPYRSNFIRLFIDGVEVTQGWLGSGLVLYGDMNIDFADHIEFYYMTPSFDTSVEPAYMTIFVYSKKPERDSGTSLDLMAGSRGYNVESLNYGLKDNGVSYMLNVSRTQERREKIDNGTSNPLDRDFDRLQVFGYVQDKRQTFHLQLMQKNSHALAGLSFDATPTVSKIDYSNVHMDYQLQISPQWKMQVSYDMLESDVSMQDDHELLYVGETFGNTYEGDGKNSAYSAELTYSDEFGDHRISAGLKNRLKVLDSFNEEAMGSIPKVFDRENIFSVFIQDQYALRTNELISLGVEYSYINRNGVGIRDDELLQLRAGYLYHEEDWHYKAYLYRSMFALDPLSVALLSIDTNVNSDFCHVQTTYGLTQELEYHTQKYRTSLMLFLLKDKDSLLVNSPEDSSDTTYLMSVWQYSYQFDLKNSVDIQLYYSHYIDIFELDELDDYSGYVSFMNSFENFDLYNSIVWHKNSIDHKNYFDMTSSISWNISEDLSFTIRGENILDKAKKTDLYRIDPETGEILSPLKISPVDRRIVFELEYQL